MNYKIRYETSVIKALDKLDRGVLTRIFKLIDSLSKNPRPIQSKKLQGKTNQYRVRAGDFRVIYTIDNENSIVRIVHVKNRKDAYR